jgi:hypothetical protein
LGRGGGNPPSGLESLSTESYCESSPPLLLAALPGLIPKNYIPRRVFDEPSLIGIRPVTDYFL